MLQSVSVDLIEFFLGRVIQASKVGSDCGNFTKILLTDPSLSRKGVLSGLESQDRSGNHVHRRIKKVGAFPSGFRHREQCAEDEQSASHIAAGSTVYLFKRD